jgi:multiple sugar transport system substrate-binding protein
MNALVIRKFRSSFMIWVLAVTATATFSSNNAMAWSLQEAAKPYAGTEVRGICDGYSPCLAYTEMAKKFEELTDIKVVLEVVDLDAVSRQILADLLTGSQYYDIFPAQNNETSAYAAPGFTRDLTGFLEDASLRDPAVKMEDFIQAHFEISGYYEDKLVSIPYHYLPPYAAYRSSIADHAEEQANFKAKYGYALPQPPTTWAQYRDLAKFFTRKKGDTLAGTTLEKNFYGTVIPFKRHLTVYYDFERILLTMGGEYVDENFNVTIDQGDVAVNALELMLEMRKFAPPGHTEATWDTEYAEMCNGNVFMIFTWGDTTPYLEVPGDCPSSAGDMSYFVHPGNHVTGAYGQSWMIPSGSQNPEAAWLFVQWLSTKEVQNECLPLGCLAVRSDVLSDPQWEDPSWPNRQREAIHIWLDENDKLYRLVNSPSWLAWRDISGV